MCGSCFFHEHERTLIWEQNGIATLGKIMGKLCMFPKIVPFFSQNGRIIRPFWEKKKWENFGKHTKSSRKFSQCIGKLYDSMWKLNKEPTCVRYSVVTLVSLILPLGKTWETFRKNLICLSKCVFFQNGGNYYTILTRNTHFEKNPFFFSKCSYQCCYACPCQIWTIVTLLEGSIYLRQKKMFCYRSAPRNIFFAFFSPQTLFFCFLGQIHA